MKYLTLTMDKPLFERLERAASRDGITLNAAILDGIGAYCQAAEEASSDDDDFGFESRPLVFGLN
jgi:hypothetical protein